MSLIIRWPIQKANANPKTKMINGVKSNQILEINSEKLSNVMFQEKNMRRVEDRHFNRRPDPKLARRTRR